MRTAARKARRPASRHAPVPPVPMPEGRIVLAPERGEFFVRDSGGSGPVVLLVHGWMFPSDLNWRRQYADVQRAGYRVLAVDARGHGRGLRTAERFRLADCADDLAAVLDALDIPTALVVGYSMGGPITQLLAQRHPEKVEGFVLCATALNWSDPRQKAVWQTMGGLRLTLGLFPQGVWRTAVKANGVPHREANWVAAELSRGSARDIAEAGRELGRFDSTHWVGTLTQPATVVITTRDRLVPPRKQRDLAAALGVDPVTVTADHDAVTRSYAVFNPALLQALSQVRVAQARTA